MIDFILAAVANFKNLLIEYYTPVFLLYFCIPLIVGNLHQDSKYNKLEAYKTSFACMLLYPLALNMLGNDELHKLIQACQKKLNGEESDLLFLFLKNLGYATIICLGGHSFIAKIYKYVTGDDYKEKFANMEKDVEEVKEEISQVVDSQLKNDDILDEKMTNIMDKINNQIVRSSDLKEEEETLIEELEKKKYGEEIKYYKWL